MSEPAMSSADALRLRLPATSANLGPGFDSAAVALDFYLDVEAEAAAEFSIAASGRDADRCAALENVLETYKKVLQENGRAVTPLAIRMNNAIPLGMGCGSSAAGRLAAIALAVHFGRLQWTSNRIVDAAYLLEGHPDNVAACWLGGFVAAACEGNRVQVAQVTPPAEWRALVALPSEPLATSKARGVLPGSYPIADVVDNIQSVALLSLAFAQRRGDLLRLAMRDRIHQPYRAPICPLLPALTPLVGQSGILGAALSGAGPAVLIVVEHQSQIEAASAAVRQAARTVGETELLSCRFLASGASSFTASAVGGPSRPVRSNP